MNEWLGPRSVLSRFVLRFCCCCFPPLCPSPFRIVLIFLACLLARSCHTTCCFFLPFPPLHALVGRVLSYSIPSPPANPPSQGPRFSSTNHNRSNPLPDAVPLCENVCGAAASPPKFPPVFPRVCLFAYALKHPPFSPLPFSPTPLASYYKNTHALFLSPSPSPSP